MRSMSEFLLHIDLQAVCQQKKPLGIFYPSDFAVGVLGKFTCEWMETDKKEKR